MVCVRQAFEHDADAQVGEGELLANQEIARLQHAGHGGYMALGIDFQLLDGFAPNPLGVEDFLQAHGDDLLAVFDGESNVSKPDWLQHVLPLVPMDVTHLTKISDPSILSILTICLSMDEKNHSLLFNLLSSLIFSTRDVHGQLLRRIEEDPPPGVRAGLTLMFPTALISECWSMSMMGGGGKVRGGLTEEPP